MSDENNRPTPVPPNEHKEHIERLRRLRKVGTHNMFTDVRSGLIDHFGEEQGLETYCWVVNHFEFYQSGKWRESYE